jgi:cyclopropane fatty-acyl-phospholipid synthase-like methyltransferase
MNDTVTIAATDVAQPETIYTAEERKLFNIMTGFFRSKLLASAVEFGLFTWLGNEEKTLDEIRAHLQLPQRSTRVFLDALVNSDLLSVQHDHYKNTSMARNYLVEGTGQYVGENVALFDSMYQPCSDLLDVLRNDRPNNPTYSYFFDNTNPGVDEYCDQMHKSSLIPALAMTQFHDFSEYRTILDVGGGYGRTCMTLVSQYENLRAILFDLPQVCEKAQDNLSKFWMANRIDVHPGDFFQDDFPQTDAILLMRITHDWPLDRVKRIVSKAFNALPSGGRLLIYETFKNDGKVAPGDQAIISLLLMLISPAGECRSFEDMRSVLKEVGFAKVEFIPTVFIYSMIVAEKP